jgi:hypothetical protein
MQLLLNISVSSTFELRLNFDVMLALIQTQATLPDPLMRENVKRNVRLQHSRLRLFGQIARQHAHLTDFEKVMLAHDFSG